MNSLLYQELQQEKENVHAKYRVHRLSVIDSISKTELLDNDKFTELVNGIHAEVQRWYPMKSNLLYRHDDVLLKSQGRYHQF